MSLKKPFEISRYLLILSKNVSDKIYIYSYFLK